MVLATMSLSEANGLDLTEASVSKQQSENITKSQPTLLGIPQELRNQIFGYVYNSPVGGRIGLAMVSTTHTKGIAFVHGKEPPFRDSILVCRQVYSEMRSMYTCAYRSFWTSNRFWVSTGFSGTINASTLVPDRDLQHIQHFMICNANRRGTFGVGLDLEKAAPLIWDPEAITQDKQYGIGRENVRNLFTNAVTNQERERRLSRNTRISLDPRAGQGLDAEKLANVTDRFSLLLQMFKA